MTILYTSIDHLHSIDLAEFRIIDQARSFLKGEGAVEDYTHLWGTPISAVLIMPFMLLPVDDIIVLKLFVLVLSVIGFAALIYLIAWQRNLYSAALVALLLIFPPVSHLKWSMMTWGGYPEAYGLMPVLLLQWVATLRRTTTAKLILLGVGSAFLMIYSPACLYVVAAVALLTFVHFAQKKDWRSPLWFVLGTALLLGPFLLSFFIGSQDQNQFRVFGDKSFRISDHVTLPQWTNLKYVIRNMEVERIFAAGFERLTLILAVIWVFFTSINRMAKSLRWSMIFPLIMMLGLAVVMFFPKSCWINTRHILGLITVGYICIGLAAADQFSQGKISKLGWLDHAVRLAVVMALLLLNLATITPLFQPEDGGMLLRYRGGEYSKNAIGSMIGPEVDRLNCLLDRQTEFNPKLDLQEGIGTVFPQNGYYLCCPYKSLDVHYPGMADHQGKLSSYNYYFTVGCSMALKLNVGKADLARFQTPIHPQGLAWMENGYDVCAASPCATAGEVRPRPDWLQRGESVLTAVRRYICQWRPFALTDYPI